MHFDPITEEIRAIRHALAAQFDNDLARIAADARERERASGRTFVDLREPDASPTGTEPEPTQRPDSDPTHAR